ncbi:hypothetical protein B0T10DRAFT_577422 [Thelonectria olida]|uniref:Uncharacterized protein n=1 Tax=Thelonectria olida TaxID=1576542 RepID=A0A9P9AMJ8_9HYPO|nr:hypothetical protein B0T10DRAFT_577422 [Thelonectria olida]
MPSIKSFLQMATEKRKSNLERGQWRLKCREALCNHIQSNLGIDLEPGQVRLQPTRDDAYAWKAVQGKEYLFQKNLSDHSIGAYKELCNGVGVIFEAVWASPEKPIIRVGGNMMNSNGEEPSFTAQIYKLQVQNEYSAQQLDLLNSQLESEVKLRLSVEEKLRISYERLEAIREELQKVSHREDYFREIAQKYCQGVSKIVPVLKEMIESPSITEDGFI